MFLCLRPNGLLAKPGNNSILVMPGLVPGIHVLAATGKTWMAGTSPAMTTLS
jgi:hypothetical protein